MVFCVGDESHPYNNEEIIDRTERVRNYWRTGYDRVRDPILCHDLFFIMYPFNNSDRWFLMFAPAIGVPNGLYQSYDSNFMLYSNNLDDILEAMKSVELYLKINDETVVILETKR